MHATAARTGARPLLSELLPIQSDASGVVALARDDAWLVGASGGRGQRKETLAQHWDGSQWSTVMTPSPGNRLNNLAAVSAVTPDEVWAVGRYQTTGAPVRLLAEHWVGGRWVHTHTPQSPTDGYFAGVSGATSDDAWAVGWHHHGPQYSVTGVIDHWDGHTWSAAPDLPDLTNTMQMGVAARSANDVWVVGGRTVGQRLRSLILHWNGRTWTTVPSPNVGSRGTLLRSVSALGPRDVWAVGDSTNGLNARPVMMHWDGQTWRIVESPRLRRGFTYMFSVSAVARDDVWAAGYVSREDAVTVIEHWNGVSWTQVESANPGRFNDLVSVSARTSNDAWAVGSSNGRRGPYRALIEHWDGASWTGTIDD